MTQIRILAFLLTAFAAGASVSKAAVILTLTNPNQTTTAGSTVSFLATAFNDDTVPVSLNALNRNLDAALTMDDSAFFNNWLSIPANSFFDPNPQELFTITVAVGTGPGTYSGTVDLLGGPDIQDQNILGSAQFSVTVNPTSGDIPEPASVLLVGAGLGLAILRARMHR
ncbi:MAG: PEP-CTERM sorting domain-containing protein [Bryobacterales bacterium]|nr:PEP-CTERM sorting domain-containing protein [Bryobacterales bacterium]